MTKELNLSKALTWGDLANEYKKSTRNSAKIKPIDSIFNWAAEQTDNFYVHPKKGTIHKILKS